MFFFRQPRRRSKKLSRDLDFESVDKRTFDKLTTQVSAELDGLFLKAHDTVFETFNCLTCANCCHHYSPIIEPEEIGKLSKAIGVTAVELFERYVEMDEDGDFVFKRQPCPMLNLENNKCSIYDDRPKACREYPHTNMKGIKNHFDLLEKNIEICPAAEEIVSRVLKQIDNV